MPLREFWAGGDGDGDGGGALTALYTDSLPWPWDVHGEKGAAGDRPPPTGVDLAVAPLLLPLAAEERPRMARRLTSVAATMESRALRQSLLSTGYCAMADP